MEIFTICMLVEKSLQQTWVWKQNATLYKLVFTFF
jgi:hypothetical protein